MANFASSEDNDPLVIDTSVGINLAATGIGAQLLQALRRPVIVVRTVVDELETGAERGQMVIAAMEQWQRDGLIQITELAAPSYEIFDRLITGATSETIDDGEAATIAYAVHISGIAVVDDVKAKRIAAGRFTQLRLATTVDLILHDRVASAIGNAAVGDAVYAALRGARMRVPVQHAAAVTELLGADRMAQCHSLPRSMRLPE